MKKDIQTKAPTVVDVIFYTLYLVWFGKIVFENFFSGTSGYTNWDENWIIILAIPALIILLVSHLIITIFVDYIERNNVRYKFNWYIILIPLALFIIEFYSAARKKDVKKEIEATPDLFETSLITGQNNSGHSGINFSFKKDGKFFVNEYNRISDDDYDWTNYTIAGDTIFLKKKLTFMPFDKAIIKNDTLRFIGDTHIYKTYKSNY